MKSEDSCLEVSELWNFKRLNLWLAYKKITRSLSILEGGLFFYSLFAAKPLRESYGNAKRWYSKNLRLGRLERVMGTRSVGIPKTCG
jgi:hypothetical protein